jgi:hypothetical protein
MISAVSLLRAIPLAPRSLSTILASDKLYNIAISCFKVGQGCCIAGYGSKEFAWDGVKKRIEIAKNPPNQTILNTSLQRFKDNIRQIQKQASDYYLVHGVFFVSSGIAATISGLHEMNLISIGKFYNKINTAANGLFVIANVVALGYNFKTYRKSVALNANATADEKTVLVALRNSSFLGMASSFQYVLAASISITGGPVAVIAALGVVAASIGSAKILYDLFYLEKYLQKY